MRNGVFIPAIAVRIAAGALAAVVVAAIAATAPDIRRYIKIVTM